MFDNDNYNYKGWLTSDYFWKRAFGVYLYLLAVSLFFFVIMIIITIILMVIFGIFSIAMLGMYY